VPSTKDSAFCVMIIVLDDQLSHIKPWPFCESTHTFSCTLALGPVADGLVGQLGACTETVIFRLLRVVGRL
jgi:hypothetical protein